MAKQKNKETDPWEKKKNHFATAALTLVTLVVFAVIIFFLLNWYTARYALP